ncbi:hypothetical protein, conserved [Babesia bigemina]|uniref:Uncharacterized protein n=1 Tax=Babesia bigemina TaxID=5866 RepID=A0A061D4Q0_BABBI|nr:hypothetical protein, conserved [Babesia bigemina]CDR95686.1 hypothetical protein, conserved [Babesia bigemina]|eukprot:XP_012767872.1 hypothetical protein, conserved [Babesia bigemina]
MEDDSYAEEVASILQLVGDEFNTVEYFDIVERHAIVIYNISGHSDFGVRFNLPELALALGNAVYVPQEFNCVRVDVRVRSSLEASTRSDNSSGFPGIEHVPVLEADRIYDTQAVLARRFPHNDPALLTRRIIQGDHCSIKISIFTNGRVSFTGGRSLLSVAVALWKLCRVIRQRVNSKAVVRMLSPTNMMAVYRFPSAIVLQAFEKHAKGCIYDPFRFSGVRLRVPVKPWNNHYDIRTVILEGLGKRMPAAEPAYPVSAAPDSSDSDEFDAASELSSSMPAFVQPTAAPAAAPRADPPVAAPPIASTGMAAPRQRQLKGNLRRIISEALPSNKRQVVDSSAKLQKTVDTGAGKRVWSTSTTISDPDTVYGREEVVTLNVFTSGNVTLTGARSVASLQYALSYIYPALKASTVKNVLN